MADKLAEPLLRPHLVNTRTKRCERCGEVASAASGTTLTTDCPEFAPLADFLLARFREGEDAVRRDWNGATGMTDERWWGTPFQPTRVLADLEAKRGTVTEWAKARGADLGHTGDPAYESGWEAALETAMRYLALPYADHPDYRQEWRP